MFLEPNQPVTSYDVAETLKNQQGTFLVQRAGQTSLVTAEEGHSIASWTPVGSIEQTAISPGTNPPYTITRIADDNLMVGGSSSRRQQSRQQQER